MKMPTVTVQKTSYGLRVMIDPQITDVALLAVCLESAAAQFRLMAETAAVTEGKRLEMKGDEDADKSSEDSSGRTDMELRKGASKKGGAKRRD